MIKPNNILFSALLLLLCFSCSETTEKAPEVSPPDAEKQAEELTNLGDTRVDEYYWMKLSEEQRNSVNPDEQTVKVLDYLNAENEYREKVMGEELAMEDVLFDEMVGRIQQDDSSVPFFENGYWYYTRFEEGDDYAIYCRKKGSLDAAEEIMLNANEMGKSHEFFSVGNMAVSPDNHWLAFSVDTVGRRKYAGMFRNLETGEILNEKLPLFSSGDWAEDSKTFIYTRIDNETLRSFEVYMHEVGTDAAQDLKKYTETDETYSIYLNKSKSGKYFFLNAGNTASADVKYLSTAVPRGEFVEFYPRTRGVEYSLDHYGSDFYVLTNEDAVNFQLFKTPVDQTEPRNWTTVIGHRPDVFLQNIELFKNYLVVSERKEGLVQLRVMNLQEGTEHYIEFDEEAYVAYVDINPEFNSQTLRFLYTSMTTPWTTYDYNMKTGERKIMKQEKVLGDFDPENYETHRIWATARDGVRVPISIVYRKGMVRDGKNPLLLYGYGSYGASMEPWFDSQKLSLLDRGWIWATAHIRGGSELGRQWYEDGRMYKKKNTFTDFIDCGEFLVSENYTSPEHLYAMGGSAGGLLMGAITNMRPDLWNGVVAQVPFVDVITTMLDESIPLTTFEYDEWGNPNLLEQYEYIKTYSPYDNVTDAEYPNMLVTTGLHDSQVQYWEPAKWVAKLRDHNKGDGKIFLYTDMEAGHGGASGRLNSLRDDARVFAFLLSIEGENDMAKEN